ncbi:hypothetical protein L7F22_039207 [Adiantum nelumboides]|nr:hypothetical protein [Adiantum nelumboides]
MFDVLSGWQQQAEDGRESLKKIAEDVTSSIQETVNDVEIRQPSEKEVKKFIQSPLTVAIGTISITAASYFSYRRYFKRIPTTAYITPSLMRWRNTIVGRCVTVGDADGFRIYHTPGPILYRHLMYSNIKKGSINGHSNGKGSSFNTQTISVRLAGADAPESSHFGKPSQPFSKEAKEELESLVLGKEVWCQMAHIDQYQRLVATPYVWHSPYIFGRTNVSLQLVKKGLATVYTQAGAAYGTAGPFTKFLRKLLGVDSSKTKTEASAKEALLDRLIPLSGEARLRRAMARAKRKKIGVWSLKNFETPEDYKKRMKQ